MSKLETKKVTVSLKKKKRREDVERNRICFYLPVLMVHKERGTNMERREC